MWLNTLARALEPSLKGRAERGHSKWKREPKMFAVWLKGSFLLQPSLNIQIEMSERTNEVWKYMERNSTAEVRYICNSLARRAQRQQRDSDHGLRRRCFAEVEGLEVDGIPRGSSLDNLDLNDLNRKKSQTFQHCRCSPWLRFICFFLKLQTSSPAAEKPLNELLYRQKEKSVVWEKHCMWQLWRRTHRERGQNIALGLSCLPTFILLPLTVSFLAGHYSESQKSPITT